MAAIAAGAGIRCCAVTVILMVSLLIQPSISIYCDEDDCYDLLGLTQNANASEIKKAYYKLSLKHHPDKNPDPESKKKFVKIANAYEILKDEATREQYDYAIAHPEEVFYNTARYYHAYYGHKTDPRAVLVGLLLILSGFQYLNQWTRFYRLSRICSICCISKRSPGTAIISKSFNNTDSAAIDMVKKTPAYKNKLRALELERSGGSTSKKKSNKQMDKRMEEDLSKELNLQIKGAEKPSLWGLLCVQFILLPYTVAKLLLWNGCWFWRYKIQRAPYSWEDASYLTRQSLGFPADSWSYIDESTKEDLIQKHLWKKPNLERYLTEMRKESKRRR